MKVKIKIPENDMNWPAQYWGKVAVVSLDIVVFDDGTIWDCSGVDTGEVATTGSGGAAADSIRALVGQNMSNISINFS